MAYLSSPDPLYSLLSDDIKPGQKTCPGLYCGRMILDQTEDFTNYSKCDACPRGYQANNESICTRCDGELELYDWLYLGFMAVLPLVLNFFFIEYFAKKKNVILLHISAIIETAVASIVAIVAVEPFGVLDLQSCGVKRLADWYTMFKNPQPNFSTTLHCTQEAVFPLYTIVFIFYTFELALMMLFRPILSYKLCKNLGKNSIYAALHFLPILVVFHAIFAGLVYYSFAYITIAVSLTTHAVHFAQQEIETPMTLLKNKRSIVILLAHWLVHAYSIVAITSLEEPERDFCLFFLVPAPAFFYLLTAEFSEPGNLQYGTT